MLTTSDSTGATSPASLGGDDTAPVQSLQHGLLTLHYGKHPATLADELHSWLSESRCSDVTLVCDRGVRLPAHRLVLASASPLMKKVLEHGSSEPKTSVFFPGISATHMQHLLDFLYTGQAYIQVRQLPEGMLKTTIFKIKAHLN